MGKMECKKEIKQLKAYGLSDNALKALTVAMAVMSGCDVNFSRILNMQNLSVAKISDPRDTEYAPINVVLGGGSEKNGDMYETDAQNLCKMVQHAKKHLLKTTHLRDGETNYRPTQKQIESLPIIADIVEILQIFIAKVNASENYRKFIAKVNPLRPNSAVDPAYIDKINGESAVFNQIEFLLNDGTHDFANPSKNPTISPIISAFKQSARKTPTAGYPCSFENLGNALSMAETMQNGMHAVGNYDLPKLVQEYATQPKVDSLDADQERDRIELLSACIMSENTKLTIDNNENLSNVLKLKVRPSFVDQVEYYFHNRKEVKSHRKRVLNALMDDDPLNIFVIHYLTRKGFIDNMYHTQVAVKRDLTTKNIIDDSFRTFSKHDSPSGLTTSPRHVLKFAEAFSHFDFKELNITDYKTIVCTYLNMCLFDNVVPKSLPKKLIQNFAEMQVELYGSQAGHDLTIFENIPKRKRLREMRGEIYNMVTPSVAMAIISQMDNEIKSWLQYKKRSTWLFSFRDNAEGLGEDKDDGWNDDETDTGDWNDDEPLDPNDKYF